VDENSRIQAFEGQAARELMLHESIAPDMQLDRAIAVVSHKFLTQPDDDLVLFLREKKYPNVLHIRHSFADAPDRSSYFTWYRNGEIFREARTKDYKRWPELMVYAKELFFTIKWIWSSGLIWDAYVGMDGLCVLFGNILRFFRKVKKTIFWAIDFVPEKRFNSPIKNAIYHRINVAGYGKSDEVWDLSPRMAEAREKFLGVKLGDYKKRLVVPYGVWTERIRKYGYDECGQQTIVFMGHLLEKQGVQVIIEALPELVKKMPGLRFKIIGSGPFKQTLVNLAERLGVLSRCDFLGKIDDIQKLENEVAKSCVAVAPYVRKLDTWTYYADPGKVKTYLACGVPVIMTDIPWNASDIVSKKCGSIISEDKNDIIMKLSELMQPDRNREYRKNAVAYAAHFDCAAIFGQLDI
jgi:glycosyltransferase involved in cell wall biosynthesis